jgi:D-glycerate 3-kinase
VELFEWKGHRAASVSIDDFYLTYRVLSIDHKTLAAFSFPVSQTLSTCGIDMTSIKPVLSIASVQDQCDLGSANTDNKLLQYRGNAGTHDLKLGSDTLVALRDLYENGSKLRVPRWVLKMY